MTNSRPTSICTNCEVLLAVLLTTDRCLVHIVAAGDGSLVTADCVCTAVCTEHAGPVTDAAYGGSGIAIAHCNGAIAAAIPGLCGGAVTARYSRVVVVVVARLNVGTISGARRTATFPARATVAYLRSAATRALVLVPSSATGTGLPIAMAVLWLPPSASASAWTPLAMARLSLPSPAFALLRSPNALA